MLTVVIQQIKSAPKDPGIYIFYHGQTPLYVGKASNLKNRLQNYLAITDLKTESLHREANKLKLVKLRSNIEALIVESQYIKKLKPRYNILWRDDKNYFYVEITKEKFPKIYITHQPNAKNPLSNVKNQYIGPFTDGNAIKAVLRLLRKSFPYCTCVPHLRVCLNAQINNCSGYCCNKQHIPTKKERSAYRKNIKAIISVLTGKNKKIVEKLKDPYQLLILDKIWAHKPYLENSEMRNVKSDMPHLSFNISQINKVECYDNSHLSGKEAVGAMTAWRQQTTNNGQLTTWVADRSMWRKFKIRGNYTEDDPRMMEEIVSRRLNHPEWPYPDLIIIDGGITQLRAAERALRNKQITNNGKRQIKIISFAKPEQLILGLEKNPIPLSKNPEEIKNFILTVINATHNFVIRYHRKIRKKSFLPNMI